MLKKDKIILEFRRIDPYNQPYQAGLQSPSRDAMSHVSKSEHDVVLSNNNEDQEEDEDEIDKNDQNLEPENQTDILEIKYQESSQRTFIRRLDKIKVIKRIWKDPESMGDLDKPKEKSKDLLKIPIQEVSTEGDCI